MAQGGDVHGETLNAEIEVKSVGFDVTAYQEDLLHVGGGGVCNGEGQEDGVIDNVKDHTDSSYVFVNGIDVFTDDPGERDPNVDKLNLLDPNPNVDSNHKDIQIRDGEINVGSCEEGNCIVEGSEVSPLINDVVPEDNSVVESNGEQVGSSDAIEEQNQTVSMASDPQQVDNDDEEKIKLESPAEEAELELPRLNGGKVKDDEQNIVDPNAEKEESEQSRITTKKSVESELNNGEQEDGEEDIMSELAIEIKQNQEPEDIVSEDVQLDLDPDKEMEEMANEIHAEGPPVGIEPNLKMASSPETNIQLESEAANCSPSNENGYSLHVEDGASESEVISDLIEGSHNAPDLDESKNNAESLISPGNCIRSETETGILLNESDERLVSGLDGVSIVPDVGTGANLSICPSSALDDMRSETENLDAKSGEGILALPADDPKSDMEVENGLLDGDCISDCSVSNVRSEPVIDNAIDHEEKLSMLPSEDASIKAEVSNGSSECASCQPASPVDDPKSEIKVGNDLVDGDCLSGHPTNDVRADPVIGNVVNLEEKASTLPTEDVSIRLEISNGVSECASPTSAQLNDSVEKGSSLPTCSGADVKSESVVLNTSACSNGGDMPRCDASLSVSNFQFGSIISNGGDMPRYDASLSESNFQFGSFISNGSALICVPHIVDVENGDQSTSGDSDDKQICQENEISEVIHRDETASISQEDSNANASDGHGASTDVVKRPFYFLIRVPRYDDENLREQIKYAQQQVEEKSQIRDAIRFEIQTERANCKAYSDNFEAAISEERTAKELLKSKRQEMDAAQSVINIAKNATSIEDIDVKIRNMEHWMQHDTLSLKKEKEFIREIKQMKQLREQFSSSMGKQDVVQQALDQRDQIEECLKTLKKEVDVLRENVMKAEAVTKEAKKKYYEEKEKQNILQAKFKAADDIRQEAYSQLHILRKKLSEKNKYFRTYKDAEQTASEYALAGNREALQRLCINQVETVMEALNKNDEFRKEYIRCNTRSTLRRLKTFDGRSLGPDEELPVLPSVTIKRLDKSIDAPAGGNFVSTREQESLVDPVQAQKADDKTMTKLVEQKEQTVKSRKKPTRPDPLGSGSATVSSIDVTEAEEELKPTKEEEELARKAEELRKQEEEAKLKEQRRLEEKAKAKEAVERKKRILEKAQARAELKAKKEAEEKEKEMEKRAKKKERKKVAIEEAKSGGNEGDSTPSSEAQKETVESGTGEKITKRTQKTTHFIKQTKSKYIPPPPLRNRGKRRMQLWMWVLLVVALLLLALFFVGKSGFIYKLALPSFHF